MLQIICAVRDIKSALYGRPFFVQSVGVAIRSFTDEVNRVDHDNMLHNHPTDFTLYQIGTYDDNDASIVSSLPIQLICGDQCREVKKNV